MESPARIGPPIRAQSKRVPPWRAAPMREEPGRHTGRTPRRAACPPCYRRLALALAATAAAGPALAQGLQPQVGAPVELGDLRRTFERIYDRQPPITERAWTITPSIDVEVSATDNVAGIGLNGTGGDVYTNIRPGIGIQGETARFRGNLYYAPSLRAYAVHANQNNVAQNLAANGTATIFEDLLFLNASAFATDTSYRGGLGPGAANGIGTGDRVQTVNLSIGPQLTHRFGDYGKLDAGYTFSYLNQYGQGTVQPTPFTTPFNQGVTTTNTGFVKFTSGEEFGRFFFSPVVSGTVFDGTGVLDGAYRYAQILSLGYAVTRTFTVLGDIGHQNIYYSGTTPYRFDGITWALGGRWAPDPDTVITFTYGERDGGTNYFFSGSTAPTPRTRLTARYSEGVSSGAEEIQNAVLSADFDAYGIPVDRSTGAPLAITNNFSGVSGDVARVSNFSVSGALLRDLDTFSLGLQYQYRNVLSSNSIGGPGNSAYLNATLGYQRELGPALRGNASFSYGTRDGNGRGGATQQTFTVSAGLYYTLSETLSTRAVYTYSTSTSNQPGYGYDMNLFTLGLHKAF